jgi:signal-transduction protein with cAMP-binding, CBS, and nucleotidyltransferase domain
VRNDVSKDTRDRIHYFYEYTWDRSKGVDEATVLLNLPPALRKIVINEIAGSVLRKIPFFQECGDASLHSILGLLKPRVFLDGDNIIRAGEYGMDFFVIESGSVKITSSDKSVVYTTLGAGDYLGESCLLGRQVIKRSASAYSCGYTYAYSLKNVDFMNVRNPSTIPRQ